MPRQKFELEGDDAAAFLQKLLSWSLDKIEIEETELFSYPMGQQRQAFLATYTVKFLSGRPPLAFLTETLMEEAVKAKRGKPDA